MYERSAIVLEKYIEKILRINKTYNLRRNSESYNELVNEIENFQLTTNKDIKVIQEFDDTVNKIELIQHEQDRLYKSNKKQEENRTQLFADLGEDVKVLESKLKKIEDIIEKNNKKIKELREEFIENLKNFSQKQKDRNKCDKDRRLSEAKIIKYKEEIEAEFKEIDVQDMVNLKEFISSDKEQIRKETLNIMMENGKNEKIPFNKNVLRKAINNRIDIAEKEAECYILAYEKMKKLLAEPDCETIKLDKYKKTLRDVSVKLAFLKSEREYIINFLDYERMTAISGTRAHNKMMLDACNNFELDIMQIRNLYELILKEISNKATEKSYKELYSKNYLKNIQDKERNFEEEANKVNLRSGTLINSNYWRIDGIKNIYMVFQEEISGKFGRDLSEYMINDYAEEDNENKLIYEEDLDENQYTYINYEEDENQYDYEYNDEDEEQDEYINNENEEENEDKDDYDEDDYDDEDDDDEEFDVYNFDNNYDDDEYESNDNNMNEIEEEFRDEDIDSIIKKSRKRANQKINKSNEKDNKRLFNKFFKK